MQGVASVAVALFLRRTDFFMRVQRNQKTTSMKAVHYHSIVLSAVILTIPFLFKTDVLTCVGEATGAVRTEAEGTAVMLLLQCQRYSFYAKGTC